MKNSKAIAFCTHCDKWLWAAYFLGLSFLSSPVVAEIITDGTLGKVTTLSAPNYLITPDLGQQVGNNLFHSFQTFNLSETETATFSGASNIARIINRVTGGQVSSIDGKIASRLANADIYFINPSGVVFGQHASLSIPQSFYVTTADVIRLENGQFNARQPTDSILSSAAPSAFGFLSNTPAPILIQSKLLATQTGKSLNLISGDIQLENTTLFASGGRINLISIAQAGDIKVSQTELTPQAIEKFGTVQVLHAADVPHLSLTENIQLADIDVSGQQGGKIFIHSGKFVVTGGQLFADSYGGNGRGIEINAENSIDLQQGRITAETFGAGLGGKLLINTPQLNLTDSGVLTSAKSTGNAGSLTVQAQRLNLQRSFISSTSFSEGSGGHLQFDVTEQVHLQQESALSSNSVGKGNAADIDVNTPILTLQQSAISSLARGNGGSGNITIHANDIQLTDSSNIVNSAQATSLQPAGALTIETQRLLLKNHGVIDSSHRGYAQGGAINITASESVQLSGFGEDQPSIISSNAYNTAHGGQINLRTPSLTLHDNAVIQTATLADSSGNAGNIQLDTDELILDTGAGIVANTGGSGTGGTVEITAKSLQLDHAAITSNTLSSGTGGALHLQADTVNLNHSEIQSVADADGNAGNIHLTTTHLFLDAQSKISAGTQGLGAGGEIDVTSETLTLQDHSSVSSQSLQDRGRAGTMTFKVRDLLLNDSELTTESRYAGGGDIDIVATGQLRISDNSQITAAAGGSQPQDTGGNIDIRTPQLFIVGKSTLRASAYIGNGGNIQIVARRFIPSTESVLDASSQFGVSGRVIIHSTETDVARQVVVLSDNYLDISAQIQQGCQRRSVQRSSFLVIPCKIFPAPPTELQPFSLLNH